MAKKTNSRKSESGDSELITLEQLDFDELNPRLIETMIDQNPKEKDFVQTLWNEM